MRTRTGPLPWRTGGYPDGATALAYRWVPGRGHCPGVQVGTRTGLLLYQFIGEGLFSPPPVTQLPAAPPPSCQPAACRPAPLLHSEASDGQGAAAFLPCCCCPALSGSPQLPHPLLPFPVCRRWMAKVLQPLNEKAAQIATDNIDLLEGSTIEPLLLQVQGRGWKCGCGVDRILP